MSLLAIARTVKHETVTPSCQTWIDVLTVDDFANSGRVLRIYSGVLNVEVLLAADNAVLSEDEVRTVYRASELTELLDITPEGLRLLHEIKGVFPGSVILPDLASELLPLTVTTASNNLLAD